MICLSEVKNEVELECGHQFCTECIGFHFYYQIKNRIIENDCPIWHEVVARPLVNKWISKKDRLKRERFAQIWRINKDPSLFWWPKPNCNNFIQCPEALPGVKNQAVCEWGHYFCTGWHEPWHEDELWENVQDQGIKDLLKKQNIKRCPCWKSIIEKDKGWNHVKWTIWGLDFGWNQVDPEQNLEYKQNYAPQQKFERKELTYWTWLLGIFTTLLFVPCRLLFTNVILMQEERQRKGLMVSFAYFLLFPFNILLFLWYIPIFPIAAFLFLIIGVPSLTIYYFCCRSSKKAH